MEVPLPEEPYTTHEEHESVREWILMVSMDQKLEQTLPKDERGVYQGTAETPNSTGLSALPCIITGYPVLRNGLEFDKSSGVANRDNWNRMQQVIKLARTDECADVMEFIRRWYGNPKRIS
ncbi:Intraflagellar transport protein [Paragonimus westermani]|uniref:Intraflagellar transport protein n=1 Tax=Paragonimus westermani TaxID=34504 RepID=A0A8T0D497_9TREM|nr:Intraflagellar transport protein [Paragonimus westermani]KAF8563539.1 Intraflagellar transport protein [Paragonimus westermani]